VRIVQEGSGQCASVSSLLSQKTGRSKKRRTKMQAYANHMTAGTGTKDKKEPKN